MDSFMEKFIADIVKGASESFARGARVPGESLNVQRDNSREEKLANHAALGSALGGLVIPGIGAPTVLDKLSAHRDNGAKTAAARFGININPA